MITRLLNLMFIIKRYLKNSIWKLNSMLLNKTWALEKIIRKIKIKCSISKFVMQLKQFIVLIL